MNFNVWNIKEMLSIPSGSGTSKSSNWNNNQTDGSALSDSQFLFGSQFCPENSEALSVSLDFNAHLSHPKQTQQNSLDSEPSIFTKYQTKPQLFGGDTKDEGLFSLPLPVGKSKGLFKQFEEKKRRATDKCDRYKNLSSEILYNFVSHFEEIIHKLQTSVEKSEEHLSSRNQSILESLETMAKTFQETARVQSDLIFEAVQGKGKMEQAVLEIQKKFKARQEEFIEMKSNLKNLEVLVVQQGKDFQKLCEKLGQLNVPDVLEELKQLISMPPVPGHVKDSTSQTSPSLAQSFNFIGEGKKTSEEPATWEIQVPPAAVIPSMSSQRPEGFGIWDKGTKSNVLKKASLPGDEPHKGSENVKDRTVQTNCKNWVITKTSLKNHGSSLPSQGVCGDKDLISQESSELDLNKFVTRFKNVCPKYQAQSKFSCDPCEQSATEQKDKSLRRQRKGNKKQTRKSHRGKPLGRKQEQTPSKTCAFISKGQSPQSPVSGAQEPFIQHWGLRGPTKPSCHVLRRIVKTNKTAKTAQGSILQSTRHSSEDSECFSSSSQGDQQISWFNNLSLETPEPPLCNKARKNLLCDPDFDSDDNF